MAKIEFPGFAEYQKKFAALSSPKAVEAAIRYASYPAAGMLVDELKKAAPVDTGDLRDSICLTPFREEGGFVYTQVEFAGYDRKGTPNALKARVLESGRSDRQKRPFIRKTVRRVQKKAEGLMQTTLDHYLYEKFGK